MPCKLNHYCVEGLRYQCPSTAPVTQGMGAGALNECLTCVQRNGNSANPIYDDLVGDCVSCYEYDSSTPYWDGTSCTACPTNTIWDGDTQKCIDSDCVFTIAHSEGNLCLVEIVPSSVYAEFAPKSADEETDDFLAFYGISERSDVYPDYWAGAVKYCKDKGLRVPTRNEWFIIAGSIYGVTLSAESASDLDISNEDLYSFIISDGQRLLCNSAGSDFSNFAYFDETGFSIKSTIDRNGLAPYAAVCVK